MPEVKSRVAFGLARGLRAFLNFNAGLVRGEAPNPERRIEAMQRELENKDQQIERLRKQASAGAGRQNKGARQSAGSSKQQKEPKNPDWFRGSVGGRWEEIGKLQFDFLRDQGLQPGHRFLDVGCGALRGGMHFVPYLDAGQYYGIDRSQRLLDAGTQQLREANLEDRRPTLVRIEDFGLERLGKRFDYALAQSVFTHLPVNLIARCLVNVDRVLLPGGVFFATFFENWNGKQYVGPLIQGDGVVSYYDQDPYHYTPDAFEWACKGTDLTADYVGDWGHPRNQLMFAFRKAA